MMNSERSGTIWHNARIAPDGNPEKTINRGSIVARDGIVVWIGPDDALPTEFSAINERHNLEGQWVTPGLIDCHTHLVYAGNRSADFARRQAGATYEEIARRGGGIVSTVAATRALDEEVLFLQSARRLEALLAEGVTTIEIKSGYGLELETERKMLRVARRLGNAYPVTVYTTFLGAHALPPEYVGRADDYIELVCNTMLPQLHEEGLVDAVDVFCESIGFTLKQSERIFNAASRLGLPLKMHAEQLSNIGGTRLAAKYGALSVDHLEYLDEAAIREMKGEGTTAVLLPAAFYFLREEMVPPVSLLRKYGIPIAIATDSNPGSSPTTSVLATLSMACTLFQLTVAEALEGVTVNAARALGMSHRHGSLARGREADFAVWSVETLSDLAYCIGLDRCTSVVRRGHITRLNRRWKNER